MADDLQPCCLRAREEYVQRVTKGVANYPVIKTIPCPTCRRVVSIRIYTRPGEAGESA